MEMDEQYKGHKITVRPSQLDNGKWTGQFVIVKFGQTDMGKRSGYADGSFDSSQEAEAAALARAKALVDSTRPTAR
jgi:hypothetical protein